MRSSPLLACVVACACGCVNTTYPSIHGGAFAESGAHAPLLEDEYLVGPAEDAEPPPSATYEEERLEVRELPRNPDLFEICTRSGCITENELVRRYRKRTGSRELDDFERDRWASVRWLGAATSGGLGVLVTTLGAVKVASAAGESTQEKRDSAQIGGGIVTGVGLAMLTMGLSFLVAPAEGATIEHYLTKSQTRRFVERHNRALRGQE